MGLRRWLLCDIFRTLDSILASFELPRAPLGTTWLPKGHQKSEKETKKGGLKSLLTPKETKREPKVAQEHPPGAPRHLKRSQNHENIELQRVSFDINDVVGIGCLPALFSYFSCKFL